MRLVPPPIGCSASVVSSICSPPPHAVSSSTQAANKLRFMIVLLGQVARAGSNARAKEEAMRGGTSGRSESRPGRVRCALAGRLVGAALSSAGLGRVAGLAMHSLGAVGARLDVAGG